MAGDKLWVARVERLQRAPGAGIGGRETSTYGRRRQPTGAVYRIRTGRFREGEMMANEHRPALTEAQSGCRGTTRIAFFAFLRTPFTDRLSRDRFGTMIPHRYRRSAGPRHCSVPWQRQFGTLRGSTRGRPRPAE